MWLYGTEVRKHYVIASLQRTGSYLLCECLENTGVLGHPTETIAPENMPIWSKRWGLPSDISFRDYLPHVVRHGTGPNGVFGVKMHWSQIEWARQQLGVGHPKDTLTIDMMFPGARYIHLTRSDIRGQAISSYRAYATEQWWIRRNFWNDMVVAPDPPYDSKEIRRWERMFERRQEDWIDYFATRKITPLHVEYDDLARDHRLVTQHCLGYLGEDPSLADRIPAPTYIRQADALTRAWRRLLDEEDAVNTESNRS